jgi:FkbM family methyltransferase
MTLRQRLKYFVLNSVPGMAGRFRYFGTRVYFPRHSMIMRVVCASGVFEPEIVRRMVALARPDTTVIDVGANLGFMAVPVLRDCPRCRVISFEPSPGTLPFLTRTAIESAHRDRWTVIGKALSDMEGELDFAVGSPQDALFEGFRSQDSIRNPRIVKVPVTTIDAEWRRAGEPEVSVIKIDVEGAEGGVLAGAHQLLDRWRPALIVEWAKPYLDRFGTPAETLVAVARRHGYRIFVVPGGAPVADETALRVQMLDAHNFLLIPEAGIPQPSQIRPGVVHA